MSNTPVTAEDLYLYAMGLLDDAEMESMEAFLQQSPEARAELENVRGDLALLALSVEVQTPPALTRQRLLKQVGRERKAVPPPAPIPMPAPVAAAVAATETEQAEAPAARPAHGMAPIQAESYGNTESVLPFRSSSSYDDYDEAPRRGFMGTVMPWAGWAVAAGLAVSTGMFYMRSEGLKSQVSFATASAAKASASSLKAQQVLDAMRSDTAQRFVLTKQSVTPVASARVTYVAENGALVFQGSNLDPLPPYKTYELWLIPVGQGRQPIPAGTFKPDDRGYASVILPELPKGVVAGTFGVTMEDDGGAQTPTLPILMIGS